MMRIGEVARSSGFSIDTLRWYDKIGLVRPARRSLTSRFREYDDRAGDLLKLVRLAKVAGLSLPEIKKILSAAERGRACDQVVPLLGQRINDIDQVIRALHDLRARLVRALKNGAPRRRIASGRSCPILSQLGKRS